MDINTELLICVEIREDAGYFCASSADVPGLRVCGETMELTRQYIMQGVRLLFKYNRDMDVDVIPVAAGASHGARVHERGTERFIVQQSAA